MPHETDPNGLRHLTPINLYGFSGSESWTHHWSKKIVLTDGSQFINRNGCDWWLNIIASCQTADLRKTSGGFQSWKLRKLTGEKKFMAVATCDDGNGNILVTKKIPFTDFPFSQLPYGLDMYVEEGSIDGKTTCWVCMLAAEH